MTARSDPRELAGCAETLAERVFEAVSVLRDRVVELAAASGPAETLHRKDIAAFRTTTLGMLREHRDIVVGMGLIAMPALLADRRRLQWWQYLAGRHEPAPLRVDLNPDSLGFYDCDAAEWFRVPRTSGRRHVVGPYIDAHGTDRYLLTFTAPVRSARSFLGVVGADVPVSVFENRMLRAWGRLGSDVMIVNSQGRVVVSNSTRTLTGDLLADAAASGATAAVGAAAGAIDLPDMPWQVRIAPRL